MVTFRCLPRDGLECRRVVVSCEQFRVLAHNWQAMLTGLINGCLDWPFQIGFTSVPELGLIECGIQYGGALRVPVSPLWPTETTRPSVNASLSSVAFRATDRAIDRKSFVMKKRIANSILAEFCGLCDGHGYEWQTQQSIFTGCVCRAIRLRIWNSYFRRRFVLTDCAWVKRSHYRELAILNIAWPNSCCLIREKHSLFSKILQPTDYFDRNLRYIIFQSMNRKIVGLLCKSGKIKKYQLMAIKSRC